MLVHVPEAFDVKKPGVIVVFFHGNGATLERDVRDRQLVPQQISDSGVNAVLLAPQLAANAADSSAGKFWQPGGFKRFIDESASHLARLYGDPKSAQAFANLPIVIVGYSGGFLPTAWSLEVGGVPTASAACSCSTPSTANSTSSRHGSRKTAPVSSSLPIPATPNGTTTS